MQERAFQGKGWVRLNTLDVDNHVKHSHILPELTHYLVPDIHWTSGLSLR